MFQSTIFFGQKNSRAAARDVVTTSSLGTSAAFTEVFHKKKRGKIRETAKQKTTGWYMKIIIMIVYHDNEDNNTNNNDKLFLDMIVIV